MTESSTTILRRMLDERDEYYKTSGNKTWWGRPIDRQTGKPINVFHYQAQPMGEDRLFVELQLATPEQAIAATLGAGTCHNTQFAEMDEKSGKKYSMAMSALRFGGFMPEDEPAEFTCSACGETASIDWETFYDIRFCPFCERKVVD